MREKRVRTKSDGRHTGTKMSDTRSYEQIYRSSKMCTQGSKVDGDIK